MYNKKNGIKDLDVYTFYRANPEKPFYSKRIKSYRFGDDQFGRPRANKAFLNKRVDCLMRAIQCEESMPVREVLLEYLQGAKTVGAKKLAEKAIVLIEPQLGEIIWPLKKKKPNRRVFDN